MPQTGVGIVEITETTAARTAGGERQRPFRGTTEQDAEWAVKIGGIPDIPERA